MAGPDRELQGFREEVPQVLLAPLLFAAGETRPEGVAPQPMRCGHRLSGDIEWIGGC